MRVEISRLAGLMCALTACTTPLPEWVGDADNDGWMTPADCDDDDPDIGPESVEICGNGIDEDCNGIDNPCVVAADAVTHTLWRGSLAGSFAGVVVQEIVDLDADGTRDLLVTAPGHDFDLGGVFLLTETPATGWNAEPLDRPGASYAILHGERIDVGLGTSVDTWGGDDLRGLGITAHGRGSDSWPEGLAYRVDTPQGLPATLNELEVVPGTQEPVAGYPISVQRWVAENDYDEPSAVATTDLDGDGWVDLLVGAPLHDATVVNSGALYVIRQPPPGDVGALADAELKLVRSEESAALGQGIRVIDLDQDGQDDIVAVGAKGATGDGSDLVRAGAIEVFDIADLAVLAGGSTTTSTDGSTTGLESEFYRRQEIQGTNAQDLFGATMSVVGDVDGDGWVDLLVGSPRRDRDGVPNVGSLHLLSGRDLSADGLFGTHRVDDVQMLSILGAHAIEPASCFSGTAADIDRSGTLDLVFASCGDGGPLTQAGEVYLFMDPAPSGILLAEADAQLRVDGTEQSLWFGSTIAAHHSDPAAELPSALLLGAPGHSVPEVTGGAAALILGEDLFP